MITEIRNLIVEEFLDDDAQIEENTSLFRDNILDSVDLVQLVASLEDEFNITISPREITPANFDTLSSIVAFIKLKQKK